MRETHGGRHAQQRIGRQRLVTRWGSSRILPVSRFARPSKRESDARDRVICWVDSHIEEQW